MSDATKSYDEQLAEIEKLTHMLGDAIGSCLPEGPDGKPALGFCLMLFGFGEGSPSSYVSNAKREDMISALREQVAHIEHGVVAPAGVPSHPAHRRGQS
jgi:hypothetical protein